MLTISIAYIHTVNCLQSFVSEWNVHGERRPALFFHKSAKTSEKKYISKVIGPNLSHMGYGDSH